MIDDSISAQKKRHGGSFVSDSRKGPGGQNRDSALIESDAASSVMVREVSAYGSRLSSQIDGQPTRVIDNTKLSALTNQIMELVLDNIRMLHMNTKLVQYCKRQAVQSDFVVKNMEKKVERSASSEQQSSDDIVEMKLQIEELRAKNEELTQLRDHERRQYQSTMRNKN